MTVPIFQVEVEDGLAEKISDNSIILSSCLNTVENLASFDFGHLAVAGSNDFDLYPLNTILVSVGWNKNSDIFEKQELWASYHTAEDKPLNIGHNHTKIVGHITSCKPIDNDGKTLASSLPIDKIPDLYHILTSAVLYKELKPEAAELKKEIQQVIAEIQQGLWFVSMECLFRGFDYGMIDAGTHKIVPRNAETAFLTKHLAAYGGAGHYNGKKIGRVLRNITFSGKGLVKNPANPYSIIIAEQFKPSLTTAEIGEEMADETKDLNAKLSAIADFMKVDADRRVAKAEAKAAKEVEKAKAKEIRKKEKAEAKKVKLEKSKAKIAELEAKVTELEKTKAEQADEIKRVQGELAEAVKAFNSPRPGLGEKEKKLNQERAGKVKEKVPEPDKALSFVEKFTSLTDEQFDAVVAALPAVAKVETEIDKTELAKKVETAGAAAVSATPPDSRAEARQKLSADLVAYLTKAKENKE